jgi:2-polyprenyl-3-methyl-5-hydroxy-6-metoxy-1,4-benzoquinol methylase
MLLVETNVETHDCRHMLGTITSIRERSRSVMGLSESIQHPYDVPYHWGMSPFFKFIATNIVERIAPCIEGKVVLDIGCGDGFTTALLSRQARRVHGFDLSPRAIKFAELIVEEPHVSFGVGRAKEVEKLAAAGKRIDVITAFEVIEHLRPDELEDFLGGCAKALEPQKGSLIVSTPNARRSSSTQQNPYHEKEFTPDELRYLFRHFKQVHIEGVYLQPPWPRLEHFANVVPFRALFRRLVRVGAQRPQLCRTLLCVASVAPGSGEADD